MGRGMIPVVFDLDGTLIDSAPDIHAAVNATLRAAGKPTLSLDRVRLFIGGGVDVLWHKIVADLGVDPAARAELVASFMTRYHQATALTALYPGVVEALGALADAGHPLALCTNKPMGPTRANLDHFGLGAVFPVVVAGDSLPQRKPAPEPLWAAVTGLTDGDRTRALYVGDSEFDAACAASAGVPLLLFTRGYRQRPVADLPHAASFGAFAELPALVARMATAPA